jgi:beta-exotoxin I transport system permease protein
VSWRLFIQTLRWNLLRWVIVAIAAVGWSLLIPVIYTTFSPMLKQLVNSGIVPTQLLSFGSGDFFSLTGAIAFGMQHPISIALVAIFALWSPIAAIAGEREGGTLEVLLARPISRRRLLASIAVAVGLVVAVMVAALLAGTALGIAIEGVGSEVNLGRMPIVWLNGFLLWTSFGAFALAASSTFDRSGPAIGLSLAYLLIAYFLEILGSLWQAASWTQAWSLFHHFQVKDWLNGTGSWSDIGLLALTTLVPLAWAWIVFPRRDLAAPA